MGGLAINAELGNRDAVQNPPLAPLKSFFRRCQFATDFDPIFSRFGGRAGAPMESLQEKKGPGARPPPTTSAPRLSRLTLG
ncbi:mCG148143 [Mus musculus]|nr:mCG148143 [Mus musculus]